MQSCVLLLVVTSLLGSERALAENAMPDPAAVAPQPAILASTPRDVGRVAVRAGFGSQTGVLGLGVELRIVSFFGIGIGTGTYALTGGPSFNFARLTRIGGPYVDAHFAWSKTYIPGHTLPSGVGAGLSAGWDWRFFRRLTVKTGLGAAKVGSSRGGPGLVLDLSAGAVF